MPRSLIICAPDMPLRVASWMRHWNVNSALGFARMISIVTVKATHAAQTLVCPATLTLESGVVNAQSVPPEYVLVVSKDVIRLSGSNLFDGHPQNNAALKLSHSLAKSHKSTWVFEGAYPSGKWFSCDYAGGLVRLAQPLQEPVSSCTDTVSQTKPGGVLSVRLDCE